MGISTGGGGGVRGLAAMITHGAAMKAWSELLRWRGNFMLENRIIPWDARKGG